MKTKSGPYEIDITGCVMALFFSNNQPVMANVEGQYMVLVCSTIEKLKEELFRLAIPESKVSIKLIHNGLEFADSLEGLHIMFDPWVTPEGNTRFSKIWSSNQCLNWSYPKQHSKQ